MCAVCFDGIGADVEHRRNFLIGFTFGKQLENLALSSATTTSARSVRVSVEVTNTGQREGDEVPQLYIHQRVSSVTRPVLALHGFQRVHLKPGEKTTVTFTLTPEDLSIVGDNMRRVVEPGIFDILVGQSSNTELSAQLTVEAK